MNNREQLEDAVLDLYPSVSMDDVEMLSSDQLITMIEMKRGKREAVVTVKPVKTRIKWTKVSSLHQVRDGELVFVELWRSPGGVEHEHLIECGDRVVYEGRAMSASILKHYLISGEWVKRVPKPRKHRAVVRVGDRVVHLGYFATQTERDAAVLSHKLQNVSPNGCTTNPLGV